MSLQEARQKQIDCHPRFTCTSVLPTNLVSTCHLWNIILLAGFTHCPGWVGCWHLVECWPWGREWGVPLCLPSLVSRNNIQALGGESVKRSVEMGLSKVSHLCPVILAILETNVFNEISYRVPKWWHHKNDFSEIMGFIQLFGTTYLTKVHMQNFGSLVH